MDCFQILAIENNTFMNIRIYTFLFEHLFQWFAYMPRSATESHMVLVFNLLSTAKMLSMAAATFCCPTDNAWVYQTLCIHANIFSFLSFVILIVVKWFPLVLLFATLWGCRNVFNFLVDHLGIIFRKHQLVLFDN